MPSQTAMTRTGGCPIQRWRNLGKEAGIDAIVDNVVSLLFVRMVALVTCQLGNLSEGQIGQAGNRHDKGQKIYADYSTTTICKAVLRPNNQSQQQQRELACNHRPRFIKSSTFSNDDYNANGKAAR